MSQTRARSLTSIALCAAALAASLAGCTPGEPVGQMSAAKETIVNSFEALSGTRFGAVSTGGSPTLVPLNLPTFPGAYAIWGSVSRDASGHIWIGVSADGVPTLSAHLFEYAPETGAFTDRGDVVSELRGSGFYRGGEWQAKIHSRIVRGADGFLYFASMDEHNENPDGSRLPTWGGHLWRLDPRTNLWEHLAATNEALIAVAGMGTKIYALGYFDHVLYQFDTATRAVRSVHVGAAGGHVSRNVIADENGHAYVPRLARVSTDSATLRATLVEYDASLTEIGETPLDHYSLNPDENSHGIVGVQHLADHSIAFATDRGYLYRIVPSPNGPADVQPLGMFHPKGEAYVSTLLTDDGRRHLMGLSRPRWDINGGHEWLVYDLVSKTSQALPVDIPKIDGRPLDNLLLYGSMTRDNEGRGYVVGTYSRDGRSFPVVFQVVEK